MIIHAGSLHTNSICMFNLKVELPALSATCAAWPHPPCCHASHLFAPVFAVQELEDAEHGYLGSGLP